VNEDVSNLPKSEFSGLGNFRATPFQHDPSTPAPHYLRQRPQQLSTTRSLKIGYRVRNSCPASQWTDGFADELKCFSRMEWYGYTIVRGSLLFYTRGMRTLKRRTGLSLVRSRKELISLDPSQTPRGEHPPSPSCKVASPRVCLPLHWSPFFQLFGAVSTSVSLYKRN